MRAVFYIARSTQEGRKVGIREIAGNIKSPEAFLAKILQKPISVNAQYDIRDRTAEVILVKVKSTIRTLRRLYNPFFTELL